MRIAAAYDHGQILQHFEQSERFIIYDIEDGKVTIATVVNTNGSSPEALPDILKKIGVDALICDSIGDGACHALEEVGITLKSGVSGSTDDAVEAILAGNNPDVICAHHSEHHRHFHSEQHKKHHTCSH